jgi:hypothetical protein
LAAATRPLGADRLAGAAARAPSTMLLLIDRAIAFGREQKVDESVHLYRLKYTSVAPQRISASAGAVHAGSGRSAARASGGRVGAATHSGAACGRPLPSSARARAPVAQPRASRRRRAMAALMNFPARSAWTLPPGFQRLAPVSPNKVALLGYEWVRARPRRLPCLRRRLHARGPAPATAVRGSGTHQRHASLAARRVPRRLWRTPLTRCRAAVGRCAQVCAILVFTFVSNQRAGLWGPTFADCAACNGTTECTTGAGGPHGLGCGYLAFGQFQCAPAYAPARPRIQLLTCLRVPRRARAAGSCAPSAPCGGSAHQSSWRSHSSAAAHRR